MIRTGKVKSVFLLVLGIAAITLIGSAAGDNMDYCFDNETCTMLQQSSMGDCQCNETMTCCMIGENLSSGNCYMTDVDQNAGTAQERLKCADSWLEKAIKLHEMHLKDPSMATDKSQMELMKQMVYAHECITGKNVTMGMMNCTAADHASVNSTSAALATLNCTDFWLEQAIKLHEMHLKYPSTATNESQMKMMEQMMNAHECIMGKNMGMEMTDQARMDFADASLKKAMELHMLHMKQNYAATNESHMKMMEQMMEHMMQANEYMTGENMTMGMTGQERMDCASASLKMAMELHMLHMKEHIMDTNKSQMEMMTQMMEHMMQANEYMTGKNMTMGTVNNTIGVKFSGECKCGC